MTRPITNVPKRPVSGHAAPNLHGQPTSSGPHGAGAPASRRSSTEAHGSQERQHADYHSASSELSRPTQKFVERYGFGDLPATKTRQYRYMSLKLLEAAKRLDQRDGRTNFVSKVHDLIAACGEKKIPRRVLENLYHFVESQGRHLDTATMMRALYALKNAPQIDLSSSKAQRAFNTVLATHAGQSGKLLPSEIADLTRVVASEHCSAGRVEQMATYVLKVRQQRTLLFAADSALLRLGKPEAFKAHANLLERQLRAIARKGGSVVPQLVAETKELAAEQQRLVKKTVVKRYTSVLLKHGLKSEAAEAIATALYTCGGPSSRISARLLLDVAALLGKKKKEALAWTQDVLSRMGRATNGFAPLKWSALIRDIHEHKHPSKLLTQINHWATIANSVLTKAGMAIDAAQAVSDLLGFTAAAEVFGAASVVLSGASSLLNLWTLLHMQVTSYYNNRNRYVPYAFWTAIRALKGRWLPDPTKRPDFAFALATSNTSHRAALEANKVLWDTYRHYYDMFRELSYQVPEQTASHMRMAYMNALLSMAEAYNLNPNDPHN